MRPPTAEALLRTWEVGRRRHPIDRGILLHALAEPGLVPDSVADEPLGRRNAALLRLRMAAFGSDLRGYLDCTRCGARLEFEMDTVTLIETPAGSVDRVEIEGLAFRGPTSRDLAALVSEVSCANPSLSLLRRCSLDGDELADDAVLESLMEQVEAELERIDSLAEVMIDFCCEVCGHAWAAPLDIAAFFWEEIEAYAVRLLDEVHVLARAYGWSEAAILSLSDSRRAAYLERVT